MTECYDPLTLSRTRVGRGEVSWGDMQQSREPAATSLTDFFPCMISAGCGLGRNSLILR